MNHKYFWPGVFAALLLSLTASLVFLALSTALDPTRALRLLLLVLAAAWLLWLTCRHPVKAGRLAAAAGLGIIALALQLLDPPLWLWLVTLTGWLWLTRSLLIHQRLLAASLDGLLSIVALAAAVAAASHSASWLLSMWSYFLVQSLYVFIPDRISPPTSEPAEDPFDRAERNALNALRRLAQSPLKGEFR